MGYPLLVTAGMRWFSDKRGFVGGLSQGLMAGGGFIFDSLQTIFVNPSDIKYVAKVGLIKHPEIIARIPSMFLYIGIIMSGMQLIALASISNPPWFRDEINLADDDEAIVEPEDSEEEKVITEYEKYPLSLKHAMKFSSFWILTLVTFFYSFLSTVALLQWKEFAVDYLLILNGGYLSLIGSSSSIILGVGRIFWGLFFDWSRNSYRLTQGLMSLIISVFIMTWPICIYSPMLMYPLWIFTIWFNVNAIFAIYPSVISIVFGAKYVGAILGWLTFAETFSVLGVVGIAPHLNQWFGGWVGYFILIGSFGLCTVALVNFFNPNIDRRKYLMNLRAKAEMMESNRLLMIGSDISSHSSNNNYATFYVANDSVSSGDLQ